MKTFVLLLICCVFVCGAPATAYLQESPYEQEQALTLANHIASRMRQEKLLQAQTAIASEEFSVDTLLENGYEAWADFDFERALLYFRAAQQRTPYNAEIAKLVYEVERAKLDYDQNQVRQEQEIMREKRLLETDQAWLVAEAQKSAPAADAALPVRTMQERAATAKVSVDFSEAQLPEIFAYLTRKTGINIVIDEAVVARAGTLSIHLAKVSLVQALESILRTKGLTYRFENDFIWVTSKEALASEEMVTRVYHLSQGLAAFTTFTTFDTVTVGNIRSDKHVVVGTETEAGLSSGAKTFEGVKIGGSGGIDGKITVTIKDVMQEIIPWPEGSSIFLDNRTSTLIARNTPSNLGILEQALKVLDVNPPQVMIEARFVEVGTDDVQALGLGMTPQVSAVGSASPTTFPFNKDQNTRYATPFPAPSATDFAFGRLDFSQFQAVLSALDQNENSNTLSSPKITTISGQEAIIKIVKEYRYPTKYELMSFTVTDASGSDRTDTFPVPSDFKTRDIGIILKVTPNVGADGKTINLTLIPEVSEFDITEDMFNYGTETQPYLQPFFNVRNATASIVVNNGDTVVMGGLMREVVDHTMTKVPLVGDIPMLGKLFQHKQDVKQKRNLLIFVTARLLTPLDQKAATVVPAP